MNTEESPMEAIKNLERAMTRERQREEAVDKLATASSLNILGADARTAFFASLILKMEQVEDWKSETAATDGNKLWFNPEFIAGLEIPQVLWVLCHEALHKGLAHPARMGERDWKTWNIATDLVVNQMLLEAGMTGHVPGAVFFSMAQYKHLPKDGDAEDTYDRLMKKQPPQDDDQEGDNGSQGEAGEADSQEPGSPGKGSSQDQQGQDSGDAGQGQGQGQGQQGPGAKDPGGCGAVVAPGDNSEADREQSKAEAALDMIEAENTAKMMGELPGGMKRLIERLLKPKVDWRDMLRSFLQRRVKTSRSWSRPNRRLQSRGIIMPGRAGRSLGDVALAIDTSGSIGREDLQKFGSEVAGILAEFPQARLTIIWHDSQVAGIQQWEPRDGPLELEPQGGGGTNHCPVFEWIAQQETQPTCLICFTDLFSRFPPAPDYPVLWATIKAGGQKIPFGIHVKIED